MSENLAKTIAIVAIMTACTITCVLLRDVRVLGGGMAVCFFLWIWG